MLIEKLREELAEFDKKAKLNVRLIQRKERLAYVTINLTNIIQVGLRSVDLNSSCYLKFNVKCTLLLWHVY